MESTAKIVRLSDSKPDLDSTWTVKGFTPLRPGARGNTKVFSSDVAKDCELVYQRYAPGYLGPYHIHRHAENVWYVVEGEMEAIVGGIRYLVRAGEAIFMPANVPHATGNRGSVDMLALEFYAPPVDRWEPRDSFAADVPPQVIDAT